MKKKFRLSFTGILINLHSKHHRYLLILLIKNRYINNIDGQNKPQAKFQIIEEKRRFITIFK